jgi:hypothetical protein
MNNNGYTALMKALDLQFNHVDFDFYGVFDLLIKHGATRNLYVSTQDRKNPSKLAWMLASEHFTISWNPTGDHLDVLAEPATDTFTEEEVMSIVYEYVNISNRPQTPSLMMLVKCAAKFEFHFDIFTKFIPNLPTPSTVLNKIMPKFYESLYSSPDVDIIYKLVQVVAAITKAIFNHPLEKIDLNVIISDINEMIVACLTSGD